jgi:hypothetical protein
MEAARDVQECCVENGKLPYCLRLLSVLGKRFGESGLSDLLIESRLIGSGSLNGVLEGKHYNRSLRTHKVCVHHCAIMILSLSILLLHYNDYYDSLGCIGGYATSQLASISRYSKK